jgi:Na+-transporting NADH:ubiquinone oxidoreductase subunit C
MSRDSRTRVLGVAFVLCLVCSVLVSAAAVGLAERQQRNKREEKQKNILIAAGLYDAGRPLAEQFSQIEQRIVDLQTGDFSDAFDPASFDVRAAAGDPATSHRIPADQDLAGIKQRSRYQTVYLVRNGEQLSLLILPVYGKGLWSTMYGFVALENDLSTVAGFAFYEHGETPGLGGEVDNPAWKEQWSGKRIYGADGAVRIRVLKGKVKRNDPDAVYQIDGLSGATLTGRGVSNLLRYWMDADGYRPFLEQLKRKG